LSEIFNTPHLVRVKILRITLIFTPTHSITCFSGTSITAVINFCNNILIKFAKFRLASAGVNPVQPGVKP